MSAAVSGLSASAAAQRLDDLRTLALMQHQPFSYSPVQGITESLPGDALYRLWLAPPDSVLLPRTWEVSYRSIEPGTVRGGIRGHHHDEACRAFEARQAKALGMRTIT